MSLKLIPPRFAQGISTKQSNEPLGSSTMPPSEKANLSSILLPRIISSVPGIKPPNPVLILDETE